MNNSDFENTGAAQKEQKKKRFHILLIVYLVFIAALVFASIFFLNHVSENIAEYEGAQADRCIEKEVARIKEQIDNGTIADYLDIASLCPPYYGASSAQFVQDYVGLLKNSEITYAPQSGTGEILQKTYAVKANGSPFATVTLEGRNERTTLFIFSMADWAVKNVTALRVNCHNTLSVLIPAGYKCYINDVQVGGQPKESVDGVPKYTVTDLPENVSVRYENAEGKALSYITVGEGLLSPVAYNYSLSLPRDITLIVDGKELDKPAAVDGTCTYQISGMTEPVIFLRDIFGNEQPYDGQSMTSMKPFSVEIPENFSLATVTGVFYAPEDASRTPDPYAAEMRNYLPDFKLNDLLTYRFSAFTDEVNVVITDNQGQKQMYTLKTGVMLSLRSQHGQDMVPAEILAQIDPMVFAVDWSKFMTNDETFDHIKKYFLKDSILYNEAYTWATSSDHKLTSQHELRGFSNKQTQDFVQYSENCFSVRVSLVKSMYLPKASNKYVDDKLDMIVYFVKYDVTPNNGKDDPTWIVAVKYDAIGG